MIAAFTVRLDEKIVSTLDEMATRRMPSRESLVAHAMVAHAIENVVGLDAWHIEKIEAGIAAADRGHFASEDTLRCLRQKYAPPA